MMPRSARKDARFFGPDGADMPVCRTCWKVSAVLRRGEIHVERRHTGGAIAHQNRRCRSIVPGSDVQRDVFLAYVEPSPIDVNRYRNRLPDNQIRRAAG